MKKIKALLIPIFLSLFLVPATFIFAQEDTTVDEDVILYDTEVDTTYDEYDYPDYDLYDYEAYDSINDLEVSDTMTAGLAAISITIWLIFMLIGLASYIFSSYALYKIGQEMGYANSWFAWVPILNMIMMFKLGEQNPNLLFLLLIPGIGALIVSIFYLIAIMNITEKRGYDKLLGLLVFTGIGTYILLYLLAWKPKTGVSNQPVYATQTPTDTPEQSANK